MTNKQLPAVVEFTDEDKETIRNTIAPDGTSDAELKLFVAQCVRTGLDPFMRQIYMTKQGSGDYAKIIIGTTIDGFRLIADRSGKYGGQVGPMWCGKDGEWKDVWLSDEPPVAAKIGVIRNDFTEPMWAVARFKGYVQQYFDKKTQSWQLGPQWKKNPENMLAICAERLALRKAFPNDLSGLYGKEELGDESVEVEALASGTLQKSPPEPADADKRVSAKGRGASNRAEKAPTLSVVEPPAEGGHVAVPSDVPAKPAPEVVAKAEEEARSGDTDSKAVDAGTSTVDVEPVATADTRVTVADPTVTVEELMGLLAYGQSQGYTEEEVSDFVTVTFKLTEETILELTKTQLAQARHHFKTRKGQ